MSKLFNGSMLLLLVLFSWQCQSNQKDVIEPNQTLKAITISDDLKWSERMALSEMYRHPESWMIDAVAPKWNYTQGLVLLAIQRLGEASGKYLYTQYAESYADTMINQEGNILTYQIDNFNIDHIAPGKILFDIHEKTGDERYLKAIHLLRKQLLWQPRTKSGGFWHKHRYPWQMWLDGLYMGAPFYAEYASRYNVQEAFDDIIHQFVIMEKMARDESTGLLYHGWDESRIQRWSDSETGCSPHFWGRAMGWYAMALVDVLDFIPHDHTGRTEILAILNRLAVAIEKVQDQESGLWFQILDKAEAKGNYLEATASCMFVYALAKGVNNNYLEESYMLVAEQAYQGILDRLIEVEENGVVNLLQCCSVAGLGGNPYRDGTYEYYIGEPVIKNDPKGTGPFIMASMEIEKRKQFSIME